MKVISLKIENLRKIEAFESEFTKSGLIQIRGKNQQGKTTILNAIEMLLKGKKTIPQDVVTHGKEQARIVGAVGDYIIERIIGKTNKLKITNKEGLHIAVKPQAFLDTLINELTFDPKPFIDKTAEQKLKFLMSLLKIDFTEIDNQIKELEQERLFTGRKVKEFGTIPVFDKIEPVDVVELIKEKDRIEDKNRQIDNLDNAVFSYQSNIEEYKEQIRLLNDKIKKEESLLRLANDKKKNLGEKESIEDVLNKLEQSHEINSQAKQYKEAEIKRSKKIEVEDEYQRLTDEIESKRKEKTRILKATKMPVEGFKIKEDGVYYNEIHSDNWSDSEALRISFELCVAMKPKLNAVFIDKGESYDNEGLLNLRAWAIENNIQVFIAIVDSGEVGKVKNAIYIEEGVQL